MVENNKFPEFWFDGNLYFGWISSEDDFKKLIESYKPHSDLNTLLTAKSKDDNEAAYGFYSEYRGNKTLKEFLVENNFNYKPYEL